MVKPLIWILASSLSALLAGGVTLDAGDSAPEPQQTCPAGAGTSVVKIGGSCSGTSCPMACKRSVCAPNGYRAGKTAADPLCNPIGSCTPYLVWKYEVRTNVSATNACPSEINWAAYKAP